MIYFLLFFIVLIWGGNLIVNKFVVLIIEFSVMSFYCWLLVMVIFIFFCLFSVIC